MSAIKAIALKEFKDGVRNRWLIAATSVFTILACSISWFGSASVGQVGFSSIANTIVSLSSLNVFLVPLIALLLAYDSIVGEDNDGTLILLLSYPLSKFQLISGKFLGHSMILGLSILVGFSAAALVILMFTESVDVALLASAFTLFIVSAIMLGMVFVALAYWISCWVSEKSKAAGLALVIWFFFVLIYDMGLLGILVATEGQIAADLFPKLLLFNPTDVFRLINLVNFESNGTGLLSIANQSTFSLPSLIACMFAWILIPFSLACWQFKKRPI